MNVVPLRMASVVQAVDIAIFFVLLDFFPETGVFFQIRVPLVHVDFWKDLMREILFKTTWKKFKVNFFVSHDTEAVVKATEGSNKDLKIMFQ